MEPSDCRLDSLKERAEPLFFQNSHRSLYKPSVSFDVVERFRSAVWFLRQRPFGHPCSSSDSSLFLRRGSLLMYQVIQEHVPPGLTRLNSTYSSTDCLVASTCTNEDRQPFHGGLLRGNCSIGLNRRDRKEILVFVPDTFHATMHLWKSKPLLSRLLLKPLLVKAAREIAARESLEIFG
jgi:hypothetical protein